MQSLGLGMQSLGLGMQSLGLGMQSLGLGLILDLSRLGSWSWKFGIVYKLQFFRKESSFPGKPNFCFWVHLLRHNIFYY